MAHSPTAQAYGELNAAYDAFNRLLFDGLLPPCLITLQRTSHRVYGYYCRDRFRSNRDGRTTTDEIAMNPMHFQNQNITEVLQTLAHEMCHLWQHHYGNPSRPGYHNREWAQKVLSIGLHPSSTGQPGGAIVGQQMSDYLIAGGALAAAIDTLIQNGFGISWYDRLVEFLTAPPTGTTVITDAGATEPTATPVAAPKPGTRVKYSCAGCQLNAWAKPSAPLKCGRCERAMLPARIARGDGNASGLSQHEEK